MDRIKPEHLRKYFTVTTEGDNWNPKIMEVMPTAYPKAYEMTKLIVHYLQSGFLANYKLKSKYWLIDFMESHEGITYFLQVKAFKWIQLKSKSIIRTKSLNRSKINFDKGIICIDRFNA